MMSSRFSSILRQGIPSEPMAAVFPRSKSLKSVGQSLTHSTAKPKSRLSIPQVKYVQQEQTSLESVICSWRVTDNALWKSAPAAPCPPDGGHSARAGASLFPPHKIKSAMTALSTAQNERLKAHGLP